VKINLYCIFLTNDLVISLYAIGQNQKKNGEFIDSNGVAQHDSFTFLVKERHDSVSG